MRIKKIFSFLKKYFIKEIEYYNFCIYCGKATEHNQRKFCSTKCSQKYWREVYSGKLNRYSYLNNIQQSK